MELDRQKLELMALIMQVQSLQLLDQVMRLVQAEVLEQDFTLTDEHKRILAERSEDLRSGNVQYSTWEEVQAEAELI